MVGENESAFSDSQEGSIIVGTPPLWGLNTRPSWNERWESSNAMWTIYDFAESQYNSLKEPLTRQPMPFPTPSTGQAQIRRRRWCEIRL